MKFKLLRALILPTLTGLAFALMIPTISAQEKAPKEKTSRANKVDANKDGVVSEEEKSAAKAGREKKAEAKALAKYDANKNGVLDPEEKAQMEADREKKKPEHREKKGSEPKEK